MLSLIEEDDGIDFSHIKEKLVLEVKRENLTIEVSQRDDDGQLLKDVV